MRWISSTRARRLGARLAFATGVALALGCAASEPRDEAPLPRHPFPTWVSHLETERTDIEEVRLVFGEPAEIEERRRGETRWRYAFREIHWAANDPDRPEVAADGTRVPRERSDWDRFRDGAADFGDFLDRLLFYPASRPERPERRTLPATIHELELVFEQDGTLRRYRYAPRQALVSVRPGR